MLARCECVKSERYKDWGGRGIKVCERWHNFQLFIADVGPRPSADHQLERINNDGDYEPGNCEWRTRSNQQRNRRDTLRLSINGITKTPYEWSKISGIDPRTIYSRAKRQHWDSEKAAFQPVTQGARTDLRSE